MFNAAEDCRAGAGFIAAFNYNLSFPTIETGICECSPSVLTLTNTSMQRFKMPYDDGPDCVMWVWGVWDMCPR